MVDMYDDKENAAPASVNLQEAFKKFRRERQVDRINAAVHSLLLHVLGEVDGSRCGFATSAASPASDLNPAGGTAEKEGGCIEG